ncbi:MAG: hypothetical protein WDM81_17955 [Rhizomicrobium sp.]
MKVFTVSGRRSSKVLSSVEPSRNRFLEERGVGAAHRVGGRRGDREVLEGVGRGQVRQRADIGGRAQAEIDIGVQVDGADAGRLRIDVVRDEGGVDGDILVGVKRSNGAHRSIPRAVGVLEGLRRDITRRRQQRGIRNGLDKVVDPARVEAILDDDAQRQHVVDDRDIDHSVGLVADAAAIDRIDARQRGRLEFGGVRPVGDDADRAAHCAFAIERALRSAQNLDLVHIVEPDFGWLRCPAAVIGISSR